MTEVDETKPIQTAWVLYDANTRVVYGVFWEEESAQELADIQPEGNEWLVKGHPLQDTTSVLDMLYSYNGAPA